MLRWFLTVALVAGAATAMIAPAVDMAAHRTVAGNQEEPTPPPARTPTFEELLIACVDSGNADSLACERAQAVSGFPKDEFRARIVEILRTEGSRTPAPTPTATPEPTRTPVPAVRPTAKPAATDDFWAVFDQCLATRDVNSAVCERAQAIIGFNDADFRAKFERYLAQKDASDFATYFEKCLATADITSEKCRMAFQLSHMTEADFRAKFESKLAARTQSDAATYFKKCVDSRDITSDRCRTAIKLSGLSEADFRAKFEAALEGDFWYWFGKCLDTRDVASDVCAKAQALIGFNDADFKAKFERYLAERGQTTVQKTEYDTAFAACVASRSFTSDACLRAWVLSGLSDEAFRQKVAAATASPTPKPSPTTSPKP